MKVEKQCFLIIFFLQKCILVKNVPKYPAIALYDSTISPDKPKLEDFWSSSQDRYRN